MGPRLLEHFWIPSRMEVKHLRSMGLCWMSDVVGLASLYLITFLGNQEVRVLSRSVLRDVGVPFLLLLGVASLFVFVTSEQDDRIGFRTPLRIACASVFLYLVCGVIDAAFPIFTVGGSVSILGKVVLLIVLFASVYFRMRMASETNSGSGT